MFGQSFESGWRKATDAPRSACVSADDPEPAQALLADLGDGPFALIMLFVSLEADLTDLLARVAADFPDCPVVGCTTAGEISMRGYETGQIVALAFPASGFAASCERTRCG